MDDDFQENEMLYRCVLNTPNYWKDGRLSSAAFKDKKGLSTDRSGGRSKKECISAMEQNLKGTVVSFSVGVCYEREIVVKYDPVPENAYHTLVLGSQERPLLTDGQAKHLARNARSETICNVTIDI